MLERKMAASPVDGLIVYPEGMPVPLHATALLSAHHKSFKVHKECNKAYVHEHTGDADGQFAPLGGCNCSHLPL